MYVKSYCKLLKENRFVLEHEEKWIGPFVEINLLHLLAAENGPHFFLSYIETDLQHQR